MKKNRTGQAEILKAGELDRIYRSLISEQHKLFFNIARYTGERFGAIRQLQCGDVWLDCAGLRMESLPEITFRADTTKTKQARTVPVCDRLRDYLDRYKGPRGAVWVFESALLKGQPVTWSACDKWLRAGIERAGLSHRGISCHSLRRTFITQLYESGLDIKIIQQITGHRSLSSLLLYIGVRPERVAQALNRAFN